MKRFLLAMPLFLGACPAFAFDCANARTASEKAICADPAARDADAQMAQAFGQLVAGASPAERAAATQSQVKWLEERDKACADLKRPELAACLKRESDARRIYLVGQPENGPGYSGRIAASARYEKGGKGRAEIDLRLLKVVDPKTPADRAFNASVDKLVGRLDPPGKDDPAQPFRVKRR